MHAFVSYSHNDATFVKRLIASLSSRGRERWIDEEGMEPSEPWRPSARDAIARADALVFVMSRSSLESDACLGEIEDAISMNKKLIPICVEHQAVIAAKPPAVAELKWIMMRPEDEFDRGVDQLVRALNTDLDLVRMHTHILVLANAWEAGGRRSSSLLRGEGLTSAEDWLSRTALGRGPPPIEVQREFIRISRRETTRRTRRITLVSLTVAVVSLALAVATFIERNRAVSQSHVSLSRAMAAQAVANLATDPGGAALLSLAAYDSAPTGEARSAVLSVIENYADKVFRHKGAVTSIAVDPTGPQLASGSTDGTIRVWDPRRATEVGRPVETGAPVRSLAYSADGHVIAAATAQSIGVVSFGDITFWRLSKRPQAERSPLSFSNIAPTVLASTPRSPARLAAGFDDGTVRIWDISGTPRLLRTLTGTDANAPVSALAISPDGRTVAVGSPFISPIPVVPGVGSDEFKVWDVATGARVASMETFSSVQALAFRPDGKFLVGGTNSGLWMWPTSSYTLPTTGAGNQDVVSIAFSPDGATLATGHRDGSVHLWKHNGLAEVGPALDSHVGAVSTVAIGPGSEVVSGGDDGAVRVWDPRRFDSHYVSLIHTFRGRDPAGPLAISPDQSVLASAQPAGPPVLWDAKDGREIMRLPGLDSGAHTVTFSPDGHLIAATDTFATASAPENAGLPGDITLWRTARPSISPISIHSQSEVYDLAFDAQRDLLAGATASGIYLWHMSGDQVGAVESLDGAELKVDRSVAFSPDGKLLAAGDTEGNIRVYNLDELNSIIKPIILSPDAVLTGHTGAVNALTFSPDGSLLASASSDQTARIWDVGSGRELRGPLLGHHGGVEAVAFSPDGRTLVTAGDDDTIRLWDVNSQAQLGSPLELNPNGAGSTLSSQSGAVGLTVKSDGTVIASDGGAPVEFPKILVSSNLRDFADYLCPRIEVEAPGVDVSPNVCVM